jgi:hypothetical protein
MRPLLAWLGLAGVLAWPVAAHPCELDYVAGRNPLSRAHQQDIEIARQKITFDLRGKRGKQVADGERIAGSVRISLELENHGPASDVVIGFPIGRYSEALYPSRDIVYGFRVKGAGAGPLLPEGSTQLLALERAGIKACERQNGAGAGYAWYAWQQRFEPGTTKLDIHYDVHLLSDWGAASDVVIGYVLSTTAGWGSGKIGVFEVDFKVQGMPGDWAVEAGLPDGAELRPGRRLHWYASDFAPKADLRFRHLKATAK